MSTTKSEFSDDDLTNLAFISELNCDKEMLKVGVCNHSLGHTETREERRMVLEHQLK